MGFAVEAEDPAVVDDAVDDRGGHVPVAEHVAPSAGLEVRGGGDAAGLVAVRAGLEQEPGPVDVDGQVAGLVDDDRPGPAYRLELGCVCSIESGPCERVESLQMSGRF